MKEQTITLYMNDPMGKWWLSHLESARRAEKELGARVIVIMKTSKEYGLEKDAPPCPSVKVNERFIVKRGLISYEQLKAALANEE